MMEKTLKFSFSGHTGVIKLNRMTGKAIYIVDGKQHGNDVMQLANRETATDGIKLVLDDGKKYEIILNIDKPMVMKGEPDSPWRYRVTVNGKTVLNTSD